MNLLRLYLFSGLVAHKAYWEFMKRGIPARPGGPKPPLKTTLIKAVKVAMLLGILAQTILPWDVLPIMEESAILRVSGAVLFSLGLATALAGRSDLGRSWADIENPSSVSNPELITHGLYRYIRHPIYTGDILLLSGLQLALNSWLILLIVLMAPLILRQAVLEERTLANSLPGYSDYCRRTKRFLPFIA